jgi:DNA-binding MarR family transcriptional regulator
MPAAVLTPILKRKIPMKKPNRPAEIYLRFLQLASAIRGLPSLPPLDPLEERILALVARASQDKERLSVRDMMSKEELGSPATVHGRLKSMRQKGWIMLSDTEDTRRKQVELTQAALLHFDKLSKCMIEATNLTKGE